jgi:hypothetical protein
MVMLLYIFSNSVEEAASSADDKTGAEQEQLCQAHSRCRAVVLSLLPETPGAEETQV